MRRIVVFVLVTAAAVTTAVVLLTGASSASARERIVAAALAQKSVHWTEDVDQMHGGIGRTSDVTADSGTQRLTFAVFDVRGKAWFRFVNDIVYVRGDPWGLRYALSLSEAQARRYAGGWISIPRGDSLYAQATEGLTLASIVDDIPPQPEHTGRELQVVKKELVGTRQVLVRMIKSERPSGWSLSAYASGEPLPVWFASFGGPGSGVSGSFSKWNERVHVQAPAHSTPIVTVRGS